MNASLNKNVFYIQRSARSLSTFFCDDSSRLLVFAADITENEKCLNARSTKGRRKKEKKKVTYRSY